MWVALGEFRGPPSCLAFVRYSFARKKRENIEMSYRVYVTDMLRNIPQMTYLSVSWADMIGWGKGGEVDRRTANQIVDDVITAIGGPS